MFPDDHRSPSPSDLSSVSLIGSARNLYQNNASHGESIRSGFSSRASFRSIYSRYTMYPEHIPPPCMLQDTCFDVMRGLTGIFYGYGRSLGELAHWRRWFDSTH